MVEKRPERASPTGKAGVKMEDELQKIFLHDWNEKLKNNRVWGVEEHERLVTKGNLAKLLKSLEVDRLIKVEEAEAILDGFPS